MCRYGAEDKREKAVKGQQQEEQEENGSGVAMSELSDAESVGDGHDHTTLQESATNTFSFSCSQTRT
ncbi:hypothetical protein EYF80_005317 [Liparis tanakae]|uniref:Uncharacterized protein n=1 Tax=Liparis tanakae TaxID=230148 RepID=A0A4Z2J3A3_9TELE|nr:hypothetical protein EYF80_005317 [Liparis tanakae]